MVPANPTASIPEVGSTDLSTVILVTTFFLLILAVTFVCKTVPINTAGPLPVNPLIVNSVLAPLNESLSVVRT